MGSTQKKDGEEEEENFGREAAGKMLKEDRPSYLEIGLCVLCTQQQRVLVVVVVSVSPSPTRLSSSSARKSPIRPHTRERDVSHAMDLTQA